MPETNYNRFIELRLEAPLRGLCTTKRPEMLNEKVSENLPYGILCIPYEYSDALNFWASKNEGEFDSLVSRDGLEEIVTSADLPDSIDNMGFVDVGGVARKVVSCGNDKIYYLSSAATPVWTLIGEATAPASLTPLGMLYGETYGEQVLVVGDGRRPHIYRPNYSSTPKYQICYDAYGYMTDYITGYSETALSLYTGSILKAGIQKTLSAWCNHTDTSVDGIPLLTMEVRLKKVGSPTGTIAAVMRDSARTTVLATSTSLDVSTITTAYNTYTFTFPTIVNQLPSTAYWWGVEFTSTSSDSSNYIAAADAAITNGGETTYTVASGWSTANAATKGVLLRVSPGLAPELDYCFHYAGRIWGVHPNNNLGYLAYSDVLNPNKWTGAVQSVNLLPDAGTLAIGSAGGYITSVIPMEDQLYIVKGGAVAEVYKLSGTGPSDFKLNKVMDGVRGSNFFAAANAGNDGYIFDPKGLVQISVAIDTQRTTESVQSRDRIDNDFFTFTSPRISAVPRYGHVWVHDPSKTNILIYDTEVDSWYQIKFKNIVHSFVVDGPDYVYVGSNNGKLYKMVKSLNTDDGTQYDLYFQSAYTSCGTLTERKIFRRLDLEISPDLYAKGNIELFRDGSYVADFTRYFETPIYPGFTVGDLSTFTVGEMDFDLSGATKSDSTTIYNNNLLSGYFAGFALGQFNFSIHGPGLIGTDYVLTYDCRRIMAKLTFTAFVGRIRLRKITLRGDLIGRRID